MDILKIRSMLSQNKNIYDLPLRVVYYARVSTEREEQLNSLDSQVMYFEDLIKKQENWQYVGGYVDEGITGVLVNKRDSFLKMIRDAKAGLFDLIVTKEVSRFARNTLDSIQYTRELLSRGVGIYFLSDNILTFDPDSELRLTIMSSLAQEEIRKLSERVKFGYKRSVEKGIVAGSNNILGYRKDKGKLVIDEQQAEIIRKIFEIYAEGEIGSNKLSYMLYDEYGYKNSRGNPIHSSNIRDIIRNPKYKGYYCANKGETLDFKTKKRKVNSKDKWIVYKDFENVPPIVSEELWDKCNKIIEARSTIRSNPDKTVYVQRFPLSRKLYCAHDNSVFVRGNYKLKEGKRIFWGCDCYRTHGKAKSLGCNSPLLYEEELAHAFKPIINTIIDNCDDIIEEIHETLKKSRFDKDYNKEKNRITDEISNLEKQKDNLFNMRSNNEISASEFADFREKINIKIDSRKKAYDEVLMIQANTNTSLESATELKKTIKSICSVNDDNVIELASSLFEKIIVETNRDKEDKRKAVLHCQLKITDSERHNLPLSQLSMLLMSNAGICRTKWKEFSLYSSIY